MTNSTSARTAAKPKKPYADFPLYAHASKRWAKKIKGKTFYFGPWRDWKAALEKYERSVHAIQRTGQMPSLVEPKLSVADLVNHVLAAKDDTVTSGELSKQHFNDLLKVGRQIVDMLGRETDVTKLLPDDFSEVRRKLADGVALTTLANRITRWQVFLNFAYDEGLIDAPIRQGQRFKKPEKKTLRREARMKAKRIYSVEDLRTLYLAATPMIRAFMLLGLNGGMGNADIGLLRPGDLKAGYYDSIRKKNGEERRFPLWPETIEAIEASRNGTEYVFATKYGGCWYKDASDSPLSQEFGKLNKACGIHQTGRGFYALRHVFRTVADETGDTVAINRVVGHSNKDTAEHYREWLDDKRLHKVVDHVREWCKPVFSKEATDE